MKYFKKLLIVLMLLMVLAGCSQKSSKPENDVAQSDTVSTEEKVEARTAIIFKQIDNKTVTVKREGEDLESYEGMRLAAGDTIITGEDTSVYLRVDDDKNILLDKDTTMVVNELSNGKLVMYLEAGAFFFDLENKLENGEEVSFDLGGTTMSIRGTSGQGSRRKGAKAFAIFTGLGAVTDVNGMEAELRPNTKVEFEVDASDKPVSYSFNNIDSKDILDVTKNYVKDNNEYQNKVEDSKWAQEVTGKSSSNSKDGSENLNNRPGLYGWIQLADGSWIFSKEAYEKKSESTYYEKPKPSPSPSYYPKPAPAPEPEPEPEPAPAPAPVPQPVICEHCGQEIQEGNEAVHTTLLGSKVGHEYLVNLFGSESQLANMILCHTHYLCEFAEFSFDTLIPHSIADEQGKIYIYQQYETKLQELSITYEQLLSLPLCDTHGICEMGLEENISNLLVHQVASCSGCEGVFHLTDLTGCSESECGQVFCNDCMNSFSDTDIHFVDTDGKIKHKDIG